VQAVHHGLRGGRRSGRQFPAPLAPGGRGEKGSPQAAWFWPPSTDRT
jgi:hypothetical protein